MSFKHDCDCAEPSSVYTRNDDVIALSALLLETNVFFTRVSAERDTQHGEESATKRCVLRKRSRESLFPFSRKTLIYFTIFIQMQHAQLAKVMKQSQVVISFSIPFSFNL